jgi:hypothetical protein
VNTARLETKPIARFASIIMVETTPKFAICERGKNNIFNTGEPDFSGLADLGLVEWNYSASPAQQQK